VILPTVESVEFALFHDFTFVRENTIFIVSAFHILLDVTDERGFRGIRPMIRDFDVEEGMVIVYKDGTCFTLFIDAEHLDPKLVGVYGSATATATATTSASPPSTTT
jgi:hypothetical protein